MAGHHGSTPDHIRLSARVTGVVQGVGFRFWTMGKAEELGLTGEVKNLDDGRLVTTVTTWGEGLGGEPRRVYAATSTGYQAYEELPTVTDAAKALTVELMESLSRRWR